MNWTDMPVVTRDSLMRPTCLCLDCGQLVTSDRVVRDFRIYIPFRGAINSQPVDGFWSTAQREPLKKSIATARWFEKNLRRCERYWADHKTEGSHHLQYRSAYVVTVQKW